MSRQTSLDVFRSDLDKEREGVWVPYRGTGVRLRIARLGNPHHAEVHRRIVEQRLTDLNARELSDEQNLDAQKEAVARAVLTDWDGVVDAEGQPLPYSPETALEFFRDPEMHRLYAFVFEQSMRDENFRKARIEADAKN